MWSYKILKFKGHHLVVIGQNSEQSLRGSWGSSNLSCHCHLKLSFKNLIIIRNIIIVLITICLQFVYYKCCVQRFMQIGEIAWEEFKKVGLWHFGNLQKKMLAYIMRSSTIQGTSSYKVFVCATKNMRVKRQNALSFIIAPPSGGNSQWQKSQKNFAKPNVFGK